METEWFNFDALNIGKDHPARTLQDTFRRARELRAGAAARRRRRCRSGRCCTESCRVYVVSSGPHVPHRRPGRDAQPGVPPDRGPRRGQGPDHGEPQGHAGRVRACRDRPDRRRCGCGRRFFPFTEPSAEPDIWFEEKKGGAGLGRVGRLRHGQPEGAASPAASIPDVYSGFAFGMGIERTLMFRNGLPDMRDMIEGDVRFTTAFGMEAWADACSRQLVGRAARAARVRRRHLAGRSVRRGVRPGRHRGRGGHRARRGDRTDRGRPRASRSRS